MGDAGRALEHGVRRTYRHVPCNSVTTMSITMAKIFARDPWIRTGGLYCAKCKHHYPVDQFVWEDGTGQRVGS